MNSKKKWLAVAVIALVLLLPFVIKKTRGDKGKEVHMAAVALQEIRPTILASGTLAYRTEINLTSELIAKVKTILVQEGDSVEKGQLLLTLDPEVYRNAIEREEASRRQSGISIERQQLTLALRQKQYERSKKLIAARMIDQSKFDDDGNQLELARVELKSSEEALRRANAVLNEAREQMTKTSILAPIAGIVVALPIKEGETAIPSTSALAGAQLMKIADTSAIQAELSVDEADIAKIAVGQQANVYAAAYPDTALKGTVEKISLAPIVAAQGRAYKVTVLLDTPGDVQLRSGMSARTDIFLSDGEKKLAVPVEAIVSEEAEDKKISRFVWLQRDGKAQKIPVEVGISDDRWEEISKGLKIGDTAVTGPVKTLRSLAVGDKLTLKAAEKTADPADPKKEPADKDAGA